MALKPGDTLLNGQYRILRQAGRGGFSFVYLAEDTLLNRRAAIKELIPALVGDEKMIRRFLDEGRATLELTHERIVRTFNVFAERDNYYIVMEYMPGGSLEQRLREYGPLPVDEAVRVAAEVCEGLTCAHKQGIVHCDLKPANILFDASGRAKVADFGIAHASDEMWTRTWRTPEGFVAGTLPYMSPEQADGVRDDPSVDVYALGAVLYRMLTGRTYLEFDQKDTPGATADNVYRIRSQQPVPLKARNPHIPDWLDGVVLKALAKQPENRYPTAKDLRMALMSQGPSAVPAPPAAQTGAAPRPPVNGPKAQAPVRQQERPPGWFWALAAGTATLLLLIAIGAVVLRGCEPGPEKESIARATETAATVVASTQVPTSLPVATLTESTAPAEGPTPTHTSRPTATTTLPESPTPTSTPMPPSNTPTQPAPEAKIAFSAARGDAEADIYIMNPDGSDATQLTFDPGEDSGPDWSPDGEYIAFHSNRSGNSDIYVMLRTGEQHLLRKLTDHPANDYDPSWSPNGQQIVFMSERDGNREIYMMNADGTNVHRLTDTLNGDGAPRSERQPAWSPQGQYIAFESRRTGRAQIYRMLVDGQGQKPLTDSERGYNISPKWSLDGLQIVFASTRDPENQQSNWPEIYVTDLSGDNQTRLTANQADDAAPAWSSDGKRIIFASKRDRCPAMIDDDNCDWDLYTMNPDGTGVYRLTNTPNLSEHNPVWWAPSSLR
jgi:Tol biopolymer transport system component/serine/threonine protein kinase